MCINLSYVKNINLSYVSCQNILGVHRILAGQPDQPGILHLCQELSSFRPVAGSKQSSNDNVPGETCKTTGFPTCLAGLKGSIVNGTYLSRSMSVSNRAYDYN